MMSFVDSLVGEGSAAAPVGSLREPRPDAAASYETIYRGKSQAKTHKTGQIITYAELYTAPQTLRACHCRRASSTPAQGEM